MAGPHFWQLGAAAVIKREGREQGVGLGRWEGALATPKALGWGQAGQQGTGPRQSIPASLPICLPMGITAEHGQQDRRGMGCPTRQAGQPGGAGGGHGWVVLGRAPLVEGGSPSLLGAVAMAPGRGTVDSVRGDGRAPRAGWL